MAGPDSITVSQLSRLIGAPDATVAGWAGAYAGRSVAVVCQRGLKLSQGVAAWLRQTGARA